MFEQHYSVNETPATVPWGWREIGATALLVTIGTVLLVVILAITSAQNMTDADAGLAAPITYLAAAGIYGLLMLGIYLFAARRGGWAALGLRPAPQRVLLLTPLLLLLGLVATGLINMAIGQLQGGSFENPQIEALTGGQALDPVAFVLLLLLVGGLVPIAEEFYFRGMIYPVLRRRFGPVATIVINAALFSLVHAIPAVLPALFVVGLLIAFLREWSGSLYPCILYHVLQNSLAIIGIQIALSNIT